MNDIFIRNPRKKLIAFITAVIVYLGLQVLSMTALSEVYTFKWMADHLYCYTWIAVLVLIALDCTSLSYYLTFGNLIGTIVGEILGGFIREQRMGKITPEMEAGEIHERSIHYGVLIWLITIIASLVVGIIVNILLSKRRKQTTT